MAWNDQDDGPWGKPKDAGNRSRRPSVTPPQPENNDFFRKAQDKFDEFFGGPDGHSKLIKAGAAVIVLVWLASGVYQVQPSDQGVVLRFGEFNRVTGAGLHYRLPAPLENVYVVNTQLVRKESFGAPVEATPNTNTPGNLMLTGDENIIDIGFDVQWNIEDARSFLFNVQDPVTTVRNVSESAMREIIGQTGFTTAQTAGKSQIEQDTRALIQQTLDSYGAGVHILTVNLLESSAPGPVVEAVRDVQAARADEERSRNEAEAYHNDIIPKARGQAERMLQDAQAYKQEVVAHAEGDIARFNSIHEQYLKAQDVTKKRMYLETMEKMFTGMNKVILQNKTGTVPYLPLPAVKAPTGGTP